MQILLFRFKMLGRKYYAKKGNITRRTPLKVPFKTGREVGPTMICGIHRSCECPPWWHRCWTWDAEGSRTRSPPLAGLHFAGSQSPPSASGRAIALHKRPTNSNVYKTFYQHYLCTFLSFASKISFKTFSKCDFCTISSPLTLSFAAEFHLD